MEQDLWRAVLRQAYDDLRGNRVPEEPEKDRVIARVDAAAWLHSPDFGAVCLLAGVAVCGARRSFRRALARGGPLAA